MHIENQPPSLLNYIARKKTFNLDLEEDLNIIPIVRTPAIVCSVIYLLEIPPDLEICDEAGDILEHNDNQDMSKHLVIAEAQSN